jgi:histidinol-phosphate/aromatic aminotransferase/cobyric acid decarboxylase-like protein
MPDPSRILSSIDSNTKLLVLCNPNNPTGRVLPKDELLQIIHSVSPATLVLLDETYIEYTPEHSLIPFINYLPNLVVVRSFSKAYALAGLRVGYQVAGTLARGLARRRLRLPWPIGLLAIKGAEAALKDQKYLNNQVQETLKMKSALVGDLGKCQELRILPSDTHYFLVDFRGTGLSREKLYEYLSRYGIYVRNCASFGPLLADSFIRITTQSAEHNRLIVSVFNNLTSGKRFQGDLAKVAR